MDRDRRRLLRVSGALASGLAGCGGDRADGSTATTGATTSTDPTTSTAEATTTTADDERTTTATTARDGDVAVPDLLVGAYYYPWYTADGNHWRRGYGAFGSEPVLGQYDSGNRGVIRVHLDWAAAAGIDWFDVAWRRPGTYVHDRIAVLADVLSGTDGSVRFSLNYPYFRLSGPDERLVDFDDPAVVDRFVADIAGMADRFFDHDDYLHLDGRPVVSLWNARTYRGDVAGAMDAVAEAAGIRPYVIADVIDYLVAPTQPFRPAEQRVETLGVYDAVTRYNPYNAAPSARDDHVREAAAAFRVWQTATDGETAFVPSVVPGFGDAVDGSHPPLSRSPSRFRRLCRRVREFVDPAGPGAVLVTSFNEWNESTQVEPAASYGTRYLDAVAETLGSPGPVGDRARPATPDRPSPPDALLGASYWPWYRDGQPHGLYDPASHGWSFGYRGDPVLGEYGATSDRVLARHLDWATAHGVDWLTVPWWYPGDVVDRGLRQLSYALADGDRGWFSVDWRAGTPPNRQDAPNASPRRFRADARYLAEQYVAHPRYLHVAGRPVVGVGGDGAAVRSRVRAMRAALDREPFVVCDLTSWREAALDAARYDAVRPFRPYLDGHGTGAEDLLATYRTVSANPDAPPLVPTVVPGVDTSAFAFADDEAVTVPRSVASFRRLARVAADRRGGNPLGAAVIGAFNDWNRARQVEPGAGYGETYLAVASNWLGDT
ncbi:MAG: hypothetical protein ABEJ08_05940 [Halobacteriaceae archaeon]